MAFGAAQPGSTERRHCERSVGQRFDAEGERLLCLGMKNCLLVASLLLVVRPGAPSSVRLLLVAMPGAPSSFLSMFASARLFYRVKAHVTYLSWRPERKAHGKTNIWEFGKTHSMPTSLLQLFFNRISVKLIFDPFAICFQSRGTCLRRARSSMCRTNRRTTLSTRGSSMSSIAGRCCWSPAMSEFTRTVVLREAEQKGQMLLAPVARWILVVAKFLVSLQVK